MPPPVQIGTDNSTSAQIARLQQQLAGMPGIGISGAAQRNNLQTQIQALQQQQGQQAAANDPNSPSNQLAANRAGYRGDIQSEISNYQSDPTTAMIQQYLQGQMGGQVLDPSHTPFQNGAPQYGAQNSQAAGYQGGQMQAAQYDPSQMGAAGYGASTMQGASIAGGTPYDATTINAMMTGQGDIAAGGESAANQMLMDNMLSNGGNASDPSMQAAMQENLTNRNNQLSQARLGIDQQANIANFNANRQRDLANQSASMQTQANNMSALNQAGQYNASNQQQSMGANQNALNQAGQYNASNQQQAAGTNLQSQNQANQFNAGNQQQTNLANQGAQNQAGIFNVQNQIGADTANFNAWQNAQTTNAANRNAAANNMSSNNNQRLAGLTGAQQNQANMYMNEGIAQPNAAPQPMMGWPCASSQNPGFALPSYAQYQSSGDGMGGSAYHNDVIVGGQPSAPSTGYPSASINGQPFWGGGNSNEADGAIGGSAGSFQSAQPQTQGYGSFGGAGGPQPLNASQEFSLSAQARKAPTPGLQPQMIQKPQKPQMPQQQMPNYSLNQSNQNPGMTGFKKAF